MRDLCRLIGWMVVDLIRSRVMLEAEIWTLLQQINVLRRTAPKKLSFCAVDRMIFVGLYRLFPTICDALAIVKPDIRGFCLHRYGSPGIWSVRSDHLRQDVHRVDHAADRASGLFAPSGRQVSTSAE